MSPPGDIRAYDVLTGRLVWTFHTVPRPGEFGYETWPKDAWKYIGGINTWGEMTVDTRRGIAYVPLGSPDLRFLRRRSRRRQSVRHVARGARRAHRQAALALPVRASRPLGPRSERGAAADHDPSQRPQSRRRRRRRPRRGWLYVFDRVTGEPIWPIEERPVPKSRDARRGRAGRRSRSRPIRRRTSAQRSASTTSVPYLPADERNAFKQRLRAADNLGLFTPISFDGHRARADEQRRRAVRRRGVRAAHRRRLRRRARQPGHPAPAAAWREGVDAAAPPVAPGQAVYQQNCQAVMGQIDWALRAACALVHATADPANNIAAGAPRFDAAAIRAVIAAGKGRMPALPHLTACRRRGARGVSDRGTGWARRAWADGGRAGGAGRRVRGATGTDCRVGLGLDAATTRRPGWPRWGTAVSRGHAAIRTLRDQRVPHRRVPHQAALHIDRQIRPERTGHQVAYRLRRRSRAGGARHYGHRHARDLNSLVVTESGLVFGAGRDNRMRAWDSDTGASCGLPALAATSSDHR